VCGADVLTMTRDRSHLPFRLLALAVAALAAFALGGAANGAPARAHTVAAAAPPAMPGELLVGFRADVSAGQQQAMFKKIGAVQRRSFKRIHGALADLPGGVGGRAAPGAVTRALGQLRSDPRVRYAEPNYVFHADATPNDPLFSRLWGLDNSGQVVNGAVGTPDADIDAPEAWSVTTGSDNVTVAVIDTGIDATHPDLSSQMWINPGENCPGCRTDGIDNDGNGYVDDWRGWDFANNDNNPADDNGHGTHVGGTIGAAGDNGIGVAGVNWHVRLMPLKFLGTNGSGTAADAVRAVLYAADKGAVVLNNSWGGDGYSQALADAIGVADSRGSLFVAAAGNNFSDNDANPTYPSSYELPNVISVAATDNRDQPAWFSNRGLRSVDLSAPGVDIYSTVPGGSYQYMSGTSMAAPQVSGAAALARAAFPGASALGIKDLLLNSTDTKSSLSGLTATGGRLNVANAVTCSGTPMLWVESPSANFETDAGKPVTLSAIASQCAQADGVQVSATANGSPLAVTARGDGLYTAAYTPAAAGAVTFAVTATAGARSSTRSVTGVASQVGTITANGPAMTVTASAPGQNPRLRFDGRAGEQVSVKLSSVSIPSSFVSILKPDGSTLGNNAYVGIFGGFLDTRALPLAGTYTILLDPQSSYTGSATVNLYDVPPDANGPITPGGAPVTISTTTPGQNMRLPFTGSAGQRVSFKLTGTTLSSAYVSILKPDGTLVGAAAYVGTGGGFFDTRALPTAGGYTILIDPQDVATGAATVTLYDVPPDAGGAIAPGGSLSVSAGTPGQNARATFTGSAGERVSVNVTGVSLTGSWAYASILKPDGTTLGPNAYVATSGGFLDTRALPVAGTYTILFDPQDATTGSATLTLYDVPSDAGGALVAGGPPLSVSMGTPGQNAQVSFDGQAGQRVSLKLANSTVSFAYISILKPDGTALGSNAFVGIGNGFVDTRTLPAAGTYRILLDPQGTATGSMTVNLYDVPPDATGTLTAGNPLSLSIATPGQNARLSFAGTAGERISVRMSGATISASWLSILKPDGTALGANTYAGVGSSFVDTRVLPAAGAYTVVLDPQDAATGSATMTVYDVPADATGSLVAGGASLTLNLLTPGQNARLMFAGTGGQHVTLSLTGVTLSASYVSILRPDGTNLTWPAYIGTFGGTIAADLPTSGTYTISVDPLWDSTGGMTLTLA
jgi:subtilisin family serine protease